MPEFLVLVGFRLDFGFVVVGAVGLRRLVPRFLGFALN